MYFSDAILFEYSDVLSRPELQIRKGSQRQVIDLITRYAHPVVPSRLPQLTQDPDDNMFLECADAARADFLLTGNQRHFPKFWKQTKMVSTHEFLSIVAPHLVR